METKNLVYFYFLRHPQMTARKIYIIWDRSKIFMEYERPQETELAIWLSEFQQALQGLMKSNI
jgi:hypothetical protein